MKVIFDDGVTMTGPIEGLKECLNESSVGIFRGGVDKVGRGCVIQNADLSEVAMTFKGKHSEWINLFAPCADLSGSEFYKTTFRRANFRRAKLARSNMHKTYWIGCDFMDSDLSDVCFKGATFERCDFRGTYMEGAMFDKATFVGCRFQLGMSFNGRWALPVYQTQPDRENGLVIYWAGGVYQDKYDFLREFAAMPYTVYTRAEKFVGSL